MSDVLTWVVHATALVAVLSIGLHLARGLNAATRYCLWWVAMAAVLLLPTAHAVWPTHTTAAPGRWAAVEPRPATPRAVVLPEGIAVAAPWIASVGIGLVLWRVACLIQAFAALRRLRARCRPLPAGLEAQLTKWIEARDGKRRVRLLLSPDAAAPAVLGAGAPIIALPAWTIDAIEAQSLDLIVLHELAHVERYDDRDLLVQACIEAVFAWHPAVWWIGRSLDAERERACDDRVVQWTGRPAAYAKCLVAVAARNLGSPATMSPGVGGAKRHLAGRVERLLTGEPTSPATMRTPVVAMAVMASAAVVFTSAAAWPRLHVPGPRWDRLSSAFMSLPIPIRAVPAQLPLAFRPWAPQSPVQPMATPVPSQAVDLADVPRPAERVEADLMSTASIAAPVGLGSMALDWTAEPPRLASLESRAWSGVAGMPPVGDVARSPRGRAPAAPAAAEFANPWKRTADAGESIGRGAAHAGVKTAGFFSRMGRAVASSF